MSAKLTIWSTSPTGIEADWHQSIIGKQQMREGGIANFEAFKKTPIDRSRNHSTQSLHHKNKQQGWERIPLPQPTRDIEKTIRRTIY